MGQHSFTKALNKLLLADNFEKISHLTVSRNWLDYTALHETQKCKILEWLLCPTEGHGQGDYFIRQLLRGFYKTVSDAGGEITDEHWPANEALASSYRRALLATEVPIAPGSNGSGRIDLLIYDEREKTLIVIERKDGASLGINQVQKYKQWCDNTYKDFKKYYLLLDSHESSYSEDELAGWTQMNDDWLVQGLKNLIGQDQLPRYIEQEFRDLLNYVFSDFNESYDIAYTDRRVQLLDFIEHNHDALEALQKSTIEVDKSDLPIIDLDYCHLLNGLLPSGKIRKCDREALLLYMQNWHFIHEIIGFSRFEKLEDEIKNKFEDLVVEHFTHNGLPGINLVHKKHIPTEEQSKESEWWPYNLKICFKQIDSPEVDQEKKTVVSVSIHASNQCHPELAHFSEGIREQYSMRRRGVNLQIQQYVDNDVLSLSRSDGVLEHLNKFYQVTKKI